MRSGTHGRDNLRHQLIVRAVVMLLPLAILASVSAAMLKTTAGSESYLQHAVQRVRLLIAVAAPLAQVETVIAQPHGVAPNQLPTTLAAIASINHDFQAMPRPLASNSLRLIAAWSTTRIRTDVVLSGHAVTSAQVLLAQRSLRALMPRVQHAEALNAQWVSHRMQTIHDQQHGREIGLLALTVIGFAIGVAAMVSMYRSLVRALGEVERAARRYGAGDLGYALTLTRDDELGRVADAMRTMATQLGSSREELAHRALHDPLTGLANRVLFSDRLEHALARTGRQDDAIAVLFLDLDMFKTVNDTRGHEAGDVLLQAVAEELSGCLRDEDTLARLGGDEFAILLEGADERSARDVASRMHAAVPAAANCLGGVDVVVSASIGVVVVTAGAAAADVLSQADLAMYAAKASGSGRTEVFRPEMQQRVAAQVNLQAELRGALERSEFEMYYQPIMDLHSGRATGVEALIRWNHPREGILSADRFIPEAEQSGLILPIGAWALRAASQEVGTWGREYEDVSLFVNVSAKQLGAEGFAGTVHDALAASRLAPHRLALEITETVLADPEVAARLLSELKRLGIRVAIDDFGAGYSSLTYLRDLPVDELKIDRAFVGGVTTSPDDEALVGTIVQMAAALHLGVVAEGVECPEQAKALHRLGCTVAQGYHYAHPMPREQLTEWLRRNRREDVILVASS